MAYSKQTWQNGDVITASKLNHMEDGISDSASSSMIAEEFDSTSTYAIGDYCLYGGTLYRFKNAHTGAWSASDVDAVDVGTMLDVLDEKKANIDGSYESMTVGNAEQLVSSVGIDDKVPYLFRTSGGSADIGNRETDKIVGGTVAWNQLADIRVGITINGVSLTNNGDGSVTINGTATALTKMPVIGTAFGIHEKVGHKLLFHGLPSGSTETYYMTILFIGETAKDIGNGAIFNMIDTPYNGPLGVVINNGVTINVTFYPQLIDLTAMFGSTIADYIYQLEQSTAGAGVAWFKKLFPKPYYAYNAGELLSVSGLQSHDMVGFNAYDPTAGTAKVVGGNQYQITGTYTALSLDGETITPDASGYFTPSASGTLTVTGGNDTDTCVHLVWDGERDGEYEEYKKWSYPIDSSLTLRGIPKLDANDDLYYDGDTYESDGTVTRRYGIVDLGTLDWVAEHEYVAGQFRCSVRYCWTVYPMYNSNFVCSAYMSAGVGSYSSVPDKSVAFTNGAGEDLIIRVHDSSYANADASTFKTAMNGVYLVYELETPTTESATPYTNPQAVDDFGTEEYVTESIVPVGHETFYQANLKAKLEMAPNSPDGDGDYVVRQSNGQNVYVPLSQVKELPNLPSENGTYVLKATVSSGTATLSWVSE